MIWVVFEPINIFFREIVISTVVEKSLKFHLKILHSATDVKSVQVALQSK
jgi:hypothetical protein